MKRKRHSPEQIIRKLREADRMLSEGQDIFPQVARWAASSLLLHEAKFRRIRGYKQIHLLLAALDNVDSKQAVA